MDKKGVPPPGEAGADPYLTEIDAVAFALNKVNTHLRWIAEHRSAFEKLRGTHSKAADYELECLGHSIQKARKHMDRLLELLLAGYSIDPNQRLPRELEELRPPEN